MEKEILAQKYEAVMEDCREIFRKKLIDYGPTWLLFRYNSMIDQLWIKIKRIRMLEELSDKSSIDEGRDSEYKGIINYSIITLIKLMYESEFPSSDKVVDDISLISSADMDRALEVYDLLFNNARQLMEQKNHDYGNAWESMDVRSITDQIITKIFRIRNILANGGKLLISENIDAQLNDIINYCVFALIKIG